ncbi:MAG: alpha/beta hydrolase [Armatimonadota bacterium]
MNLERSLFRLGEAVAWWVVRPPRLPPVVTPGMLGLPYRRFRLQGAGPALAAWHVPSPGSRRGLVLCHGHANSRLAVLRLLRPLHRAGFHLVLFDQRSMGISPGRCSFGFHEQDDTLAALRWLREEAGVEHLGLYGISMGGACALLAAARAPEVEAVVSDCAFARLDEVVERRFRHLPPGLRAPFSQGVRCGAERETGAQSETVNPEEALRQWQPRPLLVIHGDRDSLIPVEHAQRLVAAAGPGAELWVLPGAGHAGQSRWGRADPREYVRRVVGFFDQHVPNR